MHYKHIWNFAEEKQIDVKRWEKRYVRISHEDFEFIKPHFTQRVNMLRLGKKNYRTDEQFFHLHAVDKKEYVEIHLDWVNIDRLRFLSAIPHAVVDVIPFVLIRLVVGIYIILALPKYIAKFFLNIVRYVRGFMGN